MKELISLVLLFVVVAIALFAGLGSLGTIYSINTNDCAYNENHTLENCSLSNAQYENFNASATAYSGVFTTLSVVQWIAVALILLSGAVLFLGLLKK